MQWAGWSEFWAMGGYALYVWGSFAVTLAFMAAEILILRMRNSTSRNPAGLTHEDE